MSGNRFKYDNCHIFIDEIKYEELIRMSFIVISLHKREDMSSVLTCFIVTKRISPICVVHERLKIY